MSGRCVPPARPDGAECTARAPADPRSARAVAPGRCVRGSARRSSGSQPARRQLLVHVTCRRHDDAHVRLGVATPARASSSTRNCSASIRCESCGRCWMPFDDTTCRRCQPQLVADVRRTAAGLASDGESRRRGETVDADDRPLAARRLVVNGARHGFVIAARRAADEQRFVGSRGASRTSSRSRVATALPPRQHAVGAVARLAQQLLRDGQLVLQLVVALRAAASAAARIVRWVRTRASTSSAWNGLLMKSTAPSSSPRTLSRASVSAERKMTAAVARARVGLEARTRLEAVHLRHHHVEQDQIRGGALRRCERVLAALAPRAAGSRGLRASDRAPAGSSGCRPPAGSAARELLRRHRSRPLSVLLAESRRRARRGREVEVSGQAVDALAEGGFRRPAVAAAPAPECSPMSPMAIASRSRLPMAPRRSTS